MIIEMGGKTYKEYPGIEMGDIPDFYYAEVNCTCQHCEHKQTCQFAFDDYNTNGDCLAEK